MNKNYRLVPALEDDFEALMSLRWCAMHQSMVEMGTINPECAKKRLSRGFAPKHTHKIVTAEANPLTREPELLGFVVLIPQDGHWLLDHLYIHPNGQGSGLGSWVLRQVLELADLRQRSVQVVALKHAQAVSFFEKHGFETTQIQDWDVVMQRLPQPVPLCLSSSSPVACTGAEQEAELTSELAG